MSQKRQMSKAQVGAVSCDRLPQGGHGLPGGLKGAVFHRQLGKLSAPSSVTQLTKSCLVEGVCHPFSFLQPGPAPPSLHCKVPLTARILFTITQGEGGADPL